MLSNCFSVFRGYVRIIVNANSGIFHPYIWVFFLVEMTR